jgi:hypothetical protein
VDEEKTVIFEMYLEGALLGRWYFHCLLCWKVVFCRHLKL